MAIATDNMDHGEKVMKDLLNDRRGGLPWMVILDGEGQEIVASNGPDGINVGCPVEPHEVKHFVDMIKQSSDANEEELTAINDALLANRKKIKGD